MRISFGIPDKNVVFAIKKLNMRKNEYKRNCKVIIEFRSLFLYFYENQYPF